MPTPLTSSAPCLRTAMFLALVLLQATPAATFARQSSDPVGEAVESITSEAITDHLEFLASDALLGRDTPSPGLSDAADYLADEHRANGLEPAGDDSSYFQRYPFRLMAPDPETASAAFVGGDDRVEVEFGGEAALDGATVSGINAPLVVVRGTAETDPSTVALGGAVAVFPLPGDWGPMVWQESLRQADFARRAGAVGVIHVLDADFPRRLVGQISDALAEPAWRLGGDAFLPRLFVRAGVVDEGLGSAAPEWRGDADGEGPLVVAPVPGVRLQARIPPRIIEDADPPNVLARIPGTDPALRDEYVVLSAHFDHVGVGTSVSGDSIYNGADDNGSGTAALLEIARAVASLPEAERPRRTLVFAHVSGEEKGLLGSEWWVDHPTVPIEGVVANLNVDMIGGRTHPDTVAALGREYSSLGNVVEEVVAARPGLRITPVGDIWPGERLFFRSDQYNFMREGIPALFFFAGFHDCYHSPCDEVGFPDPDKIARVARLLAYTALEIANADERPAWNAGAWDEVREIIAGG